MPGWIAQVVQRRCVRRRAAGSRHGSRRTAPGFRPGIIERSFRHLGVRVGAHTLMRLTRPFANSNPLWTRIAACGVLSLQERTTDPRRIYTGGWPTATHEAQRSTIAGRAVCGVVAPQREVPRVRRNAAPKRLGPHDASDGRRRSILMEAGKPTRSSTVHIRSGSRCSRRRSMDRVLVE